MHAGLPDVEWKGAEALNGIHEEDAAVLVANLTDGGQVGAIPAQKLHEADGQQAGAAAGFFDPVERVQVGKPFHAYAGALQDLPWEVVGGELLMEGDDLVAGPPIEAHG